MDESSNRQYSTNLLLFLILAVGAFLLFFHLDQRPFWQDEAETAGLARNVLKYGVPRAFDGFNIISQEAGKEFDQNFLWRWSPWLQIYLAAGAFHVGGFSTGVGRFPFALLGLASILLVYQLVRRNFDNRAWALWAAALLTGSVPFLLYARQCRYYSLGAFLTLTTLYAFQQKWHAKLIPTALLCFSVGLLFYTNYLLFFSFIIPVLLVAVWLYPENLPIKRTAILASCILVIIIPGLLFYRIQAQSQIVNLVIIPINLEQYFGGLFQYMLPLPLVGYLVWRWRRLFWSRAATPSEPEERYILFLGLIILGNLLLLTPAPQCELRYLIHLYPLCAIILGWVVVRAWRYHKIAGVLLGFLLLFTNWLYLVPMAWININQRPLQDDRRMLTHPNVPLRLFLAELIHGYPDVNSNLIHFFQTQGQPQDLILTTYGDLPLQFYTSYHVIGGLQGNISTSRLPDWVVPRWDVRWNRAYHLNDSEKFIREKLSLATDYQKIILPFEDEIFGNNPDPHFHRFIPGAEPLVGLIIYRKKHGL